MANRWIVTALGQDRPGIVAGVTKVLYGLRCNLEDSAMTRLAGEFAIMLIFSTPASLREEPLRKAFGPMATRLKLAVHLKPLSRQETRSPRLRGRQYLISVYGADKPGIVFRIAELLARGGVNIIDVHTHRSRGNGPSLYAMLLEIEVPGQRPVAALEQRLKRTARRLGVEITLRPAESAVL